MACTDFSGNLARGVLCCGPRIKTRGHAKHRKSLIAAFLVSIAIVPAAPAAAQTLEAALVHAYQSNPVLNAERARQRGTDENVSIALSGYRPQLAAGFSPSLIAVRDLFIDGSTASATMRGYTAQIALNQIIFNGFRTGNQVRQAESQVQSGREALRGSNRLSFSMRSPRSRTWWPARRWSKRNGST